MLPNRTLLIFLGWLMFPFLSGQNTLVIDSLIVRLGESHQDSARYRMMFAIADEIKTKDTLRALDYLEHGRQITEQLNDPRGLGLYHKILGKLRTSQGDYGVAILNYDRALAYFSEAEDHVNYYETVKEKGNAYLYLSDYDQAINLYNTALDFYRRNNMVLGISRCLNNLGIIHKNRGDYVEALSVYEESVKYLDTIRDAHDISQAYLNMGNVFVFLGTYQRALEYFSKALTISEKQNDRINISICLANSGVVQNKIHNYNEALNLYRRSLIISQSNNDPVQVSNCLINLGTNYADMGELEKGLDYVERGMTIKIELEDARIVSNCYIHLAEIYFRMEHLDSAIQLFNKAIPEKERLGDQEGLARCYLGLGGVFLKTQQYEDADKMIDRALEIAMAINTKEHIATALNLRKEISVAQGDYWSAYHFLQKYHQYHDSLVDEATYKAGMEMEFRNRSKILQQENENLRIQSTLNKAMMRKRIVILYSILGIASLLAIGLMLVAYFLRRLRHSSLILEEQNLVILKQNLKLDHLNKTKDRIMSIIAHDLRGTIGNQLTAVDVLYRIEGQPETDIDRRKLLGNLKHSASYSLELLENLLHWSRLEEEESYFHPEEINLNSLILNCLALFDETARNKDLILRNEILEDITCKMDRIMMETIIRNLISNAIKFTNRGGTITISAYKEDGEICFRVSDNGIGMTPEQINEVLNNGGFTRRGTANEKGAGMGLTLVREFTHIHKGKLNINSRLDKGSLFEVIIPCIN